MGRRIVQVLRRDRCTPNEVMGTLTIEPGRQVVLYRPYRSRTVDVVRLSWLAETIEFHCAKQRAGRIRLGGSGKGKTRAD